MNQFSFFYTKQKNKVESQFRGCARAFFSLQGPPVCLFCSFLSRMTSQHQCLSRLSLGVMCWHWQEFKKSRRNRQWTREEAPVEKKRPGTPTKSRFNFIFLFSIEKRKLVHFSILLLEKKKEKRISNLEFHFKKKYFRFETRIRITDRTMQ